MAANLGIHSLTLITISGLENDLKIYKCLLPVLHSGMSLNISKH